MKSKLIIVSVLLIVTACTKNNSKTTEIMTKTIDPNLPTIGVLIFDGFLSNEVVAPLDVFTKKDSNDKALFNVILIAKEDKIYSSEEGLKVTPDFTIQNTPKLNVLVVPSSMNPEKQTNDTALIDFIRTQNKTTEYTASHCAGAFSLGKAGVADGKKIVTYCEGAGDLQKEFPKLIVQDDKVVKVARDGKIITSNGNLVSYLASLDLLEIMTNSKQRKKVEDEILISKLCE